MEIYQHNHGVPVSLVEVAYTNMQTFPGALVKRSHPLRFEPLIKGYGDGRGYQPL